MATRVITRLQEYVTSMTTSVTTMLIFFGNMSTLKAIKSYFGSNTIKRILHSWSFHMNLFKLAEGSFDKSYGSWPVEFYMNNARLAYTQMCD